MSAFFSQRRATRGLLEHDMGELERHSRKPPLDPEPSYHRGSPRHSYSTRGSEPSYRNTAAEEVEVIPRPLSSLPTTKQRGSGGPGHKHRNGSVWSQEYDGHLMRAESESYYSRVARSMASATPAARDTFEPQIQPESGAAAEPKKRLLPEKTRGALSNTCKDAAAQTDPTPKRLQRYHDALTTRTRTPQNGRRDNTIVSPGAAATLSTDRGVEVWPTVTLSRHVTHAEPDVEGWQTGPDSRRSGPGCDFQSTRGVVVERDPKVDLTDMAAGLGYHKGAVAMALPSKHLGFVDEHTDQWAGHPSSIMGNFGFENLEEFIQRIEGEAGMSQGQLEQEWALPCSTSGLRTDQGLGQGALSLSGNLDDGGDADALMLSRDWFPSETGLLAPTMVGESTAFLGEAEHGWPIPRPVLEPYPGVDGEGYPMAKWRGRDMF